MGLIEYILLAFSSLFVVVDPIADGASDIYLADEFRIALGIVEMSSQGLRHLV